MRILITGASGFIGRYLLDSFRGPENQVIAAYKDHQPAIDQSLAGDVELACVDLTQGLGLVDPVDVVIHAAGHTNLHSHTSASDYIQSNVVATLNLAEYSKDSGIKLFVYLSTISMYGEALGYELDEESPLNNPGIYGLSKYMGEAVLKEYAADFPSICIRLPGVVGPGYFSPWIGGVLQRALKNDPISIYNPGFKFNNVVHLADLSRFISQVLQSERQGFDYVNLAAAEPLAIRDVVNLIITLTGSHSEVREHPTIGNSFLIRQEKIMTAYDFEPATTESTIRRYVHENLAKSTRSQGMGVTG